MSCNHPRISAAFTEKLSAALCIFTKSFFSMLTAVPGVASSMILVRFQTMVEVDHEIIYWVILLLHLFQKKVVSHMRTYVHHGLVNHLVKLAQEKVWLDELTISQDHSC